MIIKKIEEIRTSSPLFLNLNIFKLENFFLKFEGVNIAGSIKIKTACSLIEALEKTGISPIHNKIIESSSGNLGIALSIVCKSRGYHFTCIIDPNISPHSETLMKLYGANLIKVTEKDSQGGYLGTRIELIEKMLQNDKTLIWTNQYSSAANPLVHYQETAAEILREFSKIDYLFIGVGTSGTIVGIAEHIKEHSPSTRIIAVDSVGSVTFGFESAKRYIPGLGTSRKPPICNTENIDEIMLIHEKDATQMCNYLLKKHGLFLGGSSGSALSAVKESLPRLPPKAFIIAISPDFGEKYISTIYNPEWVHKVFNISIDRDIECL